jgi:hypothetical protein
MVWAWLAGMAVGGEAVEHVDEDGAVTMTEVVPASPESLRSVLADPLVARSLSTELVSLELLSQGSCATLRATVGSPWVPVSYTYERCPTATGFRERLLESDTMNTYEVDWRLVPEGAGTRLSYTVRVDTKLPMPRSYLLSRTRASMRTAIERLLARAG